MMSILSVVVLTAFPSIGKNPVIACAFPALFLQAAEPDLGSQRGDAVSYWKLTGYMAHPARLERAACGFEVTELWESHLVEKKGVRVAVDYAQLLSGSGKSRHEAVTQTSIELCKLASSRGITLFVLCHLSRGVESREPWLDVLKDSGQLEQDADVILFLVWPYRLDTQKDPSLYEVWIGKNRNRPIVAPEVDCKFDPSRQTISGSLGPGDLLRSPRWVAGN